MVLWARRRPGVAALSCALAAVGAVGLAAVLWQWQQNRLHLYAADLRVASESIEVGDLGRGRDLLERHRPRRSRPDFAWRLLRQRAAGSPRQVLGHHPWIVGAVAWSPDGRTLASASVGSGTVNADIRLWNVALPGAAPAVLSTNGARDLAWFPDNRRLLAVGFDGRVRVWDTTERRTTLTFPGRSAGLSANGRWLMSCQGDPFAWNDQGAVGGTTLRNLETGETRSLTSARLAAISPGGSCVASTDFRGTVVLQDALGEQPSRELACDLTVWSLQFSPDDLRLVATGFGEAPLLWNLADPGDPPRRLSGHALSTWRATFPPDGATVVTTSSDQTLRAWDVRTGHLRQTWRGHGGEVWCAAFSPDGRSLASGGKDRAVIWWPLAAPTLEVDLPSPPYGRALFSSGGGSIITRSPQDWDTLLWRELDPPAEPRFLQGWGLPLAVTPDEGRLIAVAGGFDLLQGPLDGSGPSTTTELEHRAGESPPVCWTASWDGAVVLGLAADGLLAEWDTRSGRRQREHRLPGVTPAELHLSPDGQTVAVSAGEQGFWLCRLAEGGVDRLTAHPDQGKWAAFSPDSRLLATASVDSTVKLWDARTAREKATLRGHRTSVGSVAFAPDGATLISCEPGLGLRLWHLPTLRECAVIGLPEAGEWIGLAPDGRHLAVELAGGGIRLLRAP